MYGKWNKKSAGARINHGAYPPADQRCGVSKDEADDGNGEEIGSRGAEVGTKNFEVLGRPFGGNRRECQEYGQREAPFPNCEAYERSKKEQEHREPDDRQVLPIRHEQCYGPDEC